MSSVEEKCAEVMQRHAETVPPDSALLTAVKARSQRVTRNHRIAVGAAVAAAVAAFAVLPSVTGDLGNSDRQRNGQSAATSSDFLVAGPVSPPTPRWPFEIEQAPADFTVTSWSEYMFVMSPPIPTDVPAESPTAVAALKANVQVEANRIATRTASYGDPLTVGDRSGWLRHNARTLHDDGSALSSDPPEARPAPAVPPNKDKDQGLTLTLRVSETTVLEFTTTGEPWTVDRLKAFAAGVTYSGPTPPARINS